MSIIRLGRSTLVPIFLNGVFYHYINPPVAKRVVATLPGLFSSVLHAGFFMTVASLVLCMPFVYLFSNYLPRLVGKAKINGLLLKSFV